MPSAVLGAGSESEEDVSAPLTVKHLLWACSLLGPLINEPMTVNGDRVTPPSKLRIRFLYALRTISKHHNTFSDFISHFRSLFRIFTAH
jgi:hypothetical protein